MADNCKICDKIVSHTQYNSCSGMCSRCHNNPYRDLNNDEQEKWMEYGSERS